MRAACYAGDMTGSLNQFVLVKARQSRGSDHWSPPTFSSVRQAKSGPEKE
jgi:hypothetical protein